MNVSRWVLIVPLLSLIVACQADPKASIGNPPPESGVQSQKASAENSEGIVGPDEAFFAGYYLEQVFQYSLSHAEPNTNEGIAVQESDRAPLGFDYDANFNPKRLKLMTKGLFLQSDLDKDQLLSEAEFADCKLDPATFGSIGNVIPHGLSSKFWRQFAGDDSQLDEAELKNLLSSLGPMVKPSSLGLSQSHRLALVKSWGRVLSRYDTDQSGQLSLLEQQRLRQDRAHLYN